MFWTVSQGIREFCENMIANPQDWVQGPYTFMNLKHPDIQVWTSNGLSFIRIVGNDGLTPAEKRLVLNAVKLTTARKLALGNNAPKGEK